MELFAILRRDGWADGPALEQAAARSTEVGDGMPHDIRWIRSYVLGGVRRIIGHRVHLRGEQQGGYSRTRRCSRSACYGDYSDC